MHTFEVRTWIAMLTLRDTLDYAKQIICSAGNLVAIVQRPLPVAKHCERVSILGLDNGDLRKYIVSPPLPIYVKFMVKMVTN